MEELSEELTRDKAKEEKEKEIRVVAHCLLNSSTRVKGLRPLEFHIRTETEGGGEWPLIQLPCPEALYMGLDRWAVTRNQLDVPEFRRFCRSLLIHYADIIEMLAKKGFRIRIMGVAGSPSCGVCTTSSGYTGGRVRECEHAHVVGRGVFMEELMEELGWRGVKVTVEEIGKDRSGKRTDEAEFGSMPGIAPFKREEIDRFES
jgi:predicted secreted protein